MPQLIDPTPRLHTSWLAAAEEVGGPGTHQQGTGTGTPGDLADLEVFTAWTEELLASSDPLVPIPDGRVHSHYWWVVEGDEYVGAIALRHSLNEYLLEVGGHIGYSVRPTARRRGIASWALAAVLPRALELGISRVLITCEDGNVGSARTIESCGGILEDIRDDAGRPTRRYWISL